MWFDTHAHLGVSKFTGVTTREADLIAAMNKHGVACALVMPQPTLEPISAIHDRIAALAEAHPFRIMGIASPDPWMDERAYVKEVRRAVNGLGFVAVKLHTLGHSISPLAGPAEKVFGIASELGVPVIVHTGLGTPFALPSLVLPRALTYPELPIILAHAGYAVYTDEALVAAEIAENIYLEPSWCATYQVRRFVETLGPGRLMMGSDHLDNVPVEMARYHALALPPEAMRAIRYETALKVFKVPSSAWEAARASAAKERGSLP